MSITASQVKELRDKTGAGMMDCKRALSETDGDVEAAVAHLREKGLASAGKKAGRVAAEGAVGVFGAADGKSAVMAELNSETDFVAKNENFAALLERVGAALLASDVTEGDGESAAGLSVDGAASLGELLAESVAAIGENLSLRRFVRATSEDGIVGSYIHAGGKIGVAIELAGGRADESAHTELARSLAMQVAAAMPRYARREEVPQDIVDAESEIFRNQALASGKPEKVLDRIIGGKIEKFFGESCLVEQAFVRDPDVTVGKLLESVGKETGAELSVTRFLRYQLGEGIEKKEANLAQEVAEQIAQGS